MVINHAKKNFVLLFSGGVLMVFIVLYILSYYATYKLSEPLIKADQTTAKLFKSLGDASHQSATLDSLYNIMESRKLHHFLASQAYYRYYFTFNLMLLFLSGIISLCLFFVAKSGWDKADKMYRYILFCSLFYASLFYLLPNVLDNKANLTNNVLQYGKYNQQELKTIEGLYKYNIEKQGTIIDTLVQQNCKMLEDNLSLYFEMNDTKINKDPFEALKK